VAFTKEDSAETASETLLPDRPVSPHPNLVTEAGLTSLELQLHQAREAYETAQKIEDVNERRRQAATPLRDGRYFATRVFKEAIHQSHFGQIALQIPESLRVSSIFYLETSIQTPGFSKREEWAIMCGSGRLSLFHPRAPLHSKTLKPR
jgi:hypothetical protein